jgi:cytochrome bd-type quinol oxidase subunit 1
VTSLAIFVLLYGALVVVDWMLMARFARKRLALEPFREDEAAAVPEPSY